MQVNHDNFSSAHEDVKARLFKAELIAVDCEFTGCKVGGESDSYLDTVAERENKLCLIAEGHTITQLGLTICGYTSDSQEELELASYNILLAPEGVFVVDAESLKFIRENHGDLNLWVDKGVRSGRRASSKQHLQQLFDLQATTRERAFVCDATCLRDLRRKGFDFNQWVDTADMSAEDAAQFYRHVEEAPAQGSLRDFWKLLHDARVPIVVHGQLDILFLLHAARGQLLPRNPTKLAMLIKECFPGGVYDTSYLHEALPEFRITPKNLKDFFSIAQKRVHERCREAKVLRLAQGVTRDHYGKALARGPEGPAERSDLQHEAGFDSLQTALLFLSLKELNPKGVEDSVNRLSLHRSVDCFDVNSAAKRGPSHGSVYGDDAYLHVVVPITADAMDKTTDRISQVRKSSKRSIIYRRLDETDSKEKTGALLIVFGQRDGEQGVQALAKELPGVRWKKFQVWQQDGRVTRYQEGYQTTSVRDENQSFHGRIKSFNQETGYGFIESAQAVGVFGAGDVYLAKQQLGDCSQGDDVTFTVTLSKKEGKPQALNVKRAFPAAPPGKFMQQDVEESLRDRQLELELQMAPAEPLKPGLVTAPVRRGVVKSYIPKALGKGYGFIRTPGIENDIWVNSTHIIGRTGLEVGEIVQFDLATDGSGRFQAHQVRVIPNAAVATNVTNTGGKGKGGKGKAEAKAKSSSSVFKAHLTSTGRTYVGRVKSFGAQNGYGFIECAEIKAQYGGDCFCAGKYLGNCKVGDMVEFDVGVTPENKPQAESPVRPTAGADVLLQYKTERSEDTRTSSMCPSTCTESLSWCGKSEDGASSEDSPDVPASATTSYQ